MDEFITDDQLCDALGMELKYYHQIVDCLLLKKYNLTGVIKIIKNDSLIQYQESLDSIYSHNFNNVSPKVVWAWNIGVVEEIADRILNKYKLCRNLIDEHMASQ